MTIKTLSRAIKTEGPIIIKEAGKPLYVILDWNTYQKFEEQRDEIEDTERYRAAISDPKNKKRVPWDSVKMRLRLKK